MAEWDQIEYGVSSALVAVECLRTIDRIRVRRSLSDDDVVVRCTALREVLDRVQLIPLSAPVLARASDPFPTTLGTLDALHLSSALLWQQSEGQRLTLLTHDVELGRAARAMGMAVRGDEQWP